MEVSEAERDKNRIYNGGNRRDEEWRYRVQCMILPHTQVQTNEGRRGEKERRKGDRRLEGGIIIALLEGHRAQRGACDPLHGTFGVRRWTPPPCGGGRRAEQTSGRLALGVVHVVR